MNVELQNRNNPILEDGEVTTIGLMMMDSANPQPSPSPVGIGYMNGVPHVFMSDGSISQSSKLLNDSGKLDYQKGLADAAYDKMNATMRQAYATSNSVKSLHNRDASGDPYAEYLRDTSSAWSA